MQLLATNLPTPWRISCMKYQYLFSNFTTCYRKQNFVSLFICRSPETQEFRLLPPATFFLDSFYYNASNNNCLKSISQYPLHQLKLFDWFMFSMFPIEILCAFLFFPFPSHAPPIACFLNYHASNVCGRSHIIKLLNSRCSPGF